MSFINSKRITSIVILLILCLAAYPQSKLDSLQHLKEVVITSKPFQEVIPSQKLTGKELERLSSHNVADALRYFAGVQIKDYGGLGGLKTVNIRSMGSQHVGVFYDGIQLGNAQNGVIDLGKFSLDDMEEISLYNGQKSEIFQPAKDFGSAGSIYLRTKKPHFEGDKKTNVLAKYKFSSINLINPSLRLEQKLSNRLSASLSGEFMKSDGEYKYRDKRLNFDNTVAYDTTAVRHDSDIETYRLEAALNGTFNDGYWDAKGYSYFSDRGIPGAIVNNVYLRGQRLVDKNAFFQGSIFRKFSEKYESQLRAKFAYDYTHYADTLLASMRVNNKYMQQEAYISWVNKYSISPIWEVNLSADFQWNKLNSNMKQFSFPQRYTTMTALATSLNLEKFKAQASILGTFVQETVKMNSKSPDKAEFSPAVFLGYKPFENRDLNFRAFYKRIFRMPTFNDLYYTLLGNSLLKPEYTNQYNIGATYGKKIEDPIFRNIDFQADAYYINVEDKIVAMPTTNQFRWTMINLGLVEIKGIDLKAGLSAAIDKVSMNLNLTYTYQKAQDFTDRSQSYFGDQIPYTPWHSGSVILNGNYNSWNLNYSFMYVGKRYDANQNNIEYNRLQPWYTHDMSLQKEFTYKQYKLKGTIEMNNMFNQFYEVIRCYPMPGRNFKFIISLTI